MSAPRWLPLESNPDVMTKCLVEYGMNDKWAVVDVLGFDPELLDMLPKPVAALILLYPVSKVDAGAAGTMENIPSDLFYMKQTIHNACGTIALIHAVCNNLETIPLTSGGLLEEFYQRNKGKSPEERGKDLETSQAMAVTHAENAQEGQTEAPDLAADVDYHFIAFVQKNGHLYELDGRKAGPVDHGKTASESFTTDAAQVCKKFMAKNPECLDFTAVALCKISGD